MCFSEFLNVLSVDETERRPYNAEIEIVIEKITFQCAACDFISHSWQQRKVKKERPTCHTK